MFKKGDVVEWVCDEYGHTTREGTCFSVLISDLVKGSDEFSGVVVSAKEKADYREGTYLDCWDVKQFKLKQQAVNSVDTHDNPFPLLQDGMVVETRCRGSYLICSGKVIRNEGYNRLASYEKDGKYKGSNSKFDIVRVYSGENLYNLDLVEYIADYPEDLVWEEQKNAKAIAEVVEQMVVLQEQLSTLQEKLVTLREEK